MAEQPRFVDLVKGVNDNLTDGSVRHGFGGAIALAYYVGSPRATRDLDINIAVPVHDAAAVFSLLPPAVAWDDKDVAECQERGQVRLWAGRRREGIPVDLFFPQHRFHDVVASAITDRPFMTSDYRLPVIAASHLVVFKTLFNRPRDWVDMSEMVRAGSVDVADALYWVRELLGEEHPSFGRLVSVVAGSKEHRDDPEDGMQDLPEVDWSSLGGDS